VVDEPGTVAAAGSFWIGNAASSALRALGFADPSTPSWVRPVQIAAGLAVALVLVRLGRWRGVVMAGLAIRLMLDPAVHHYYAAGLTLGVLLWELTRRPDRPPWLTGVTAVLLEATPTDVQPSALAGGLRLALTAALIIAAFLPDPPGDAEDQPRGAPLERLPRPSRITPY
jgi:hypothetical protein